jgi:hypothetical protein
MKLSNDQIELRDLLHRFFQEQVTSPHLRERMEKRIRRDPQLHQRFSELGIVDGFRGDTPLFSITELGVLARECGFALVPEPVLEQIIADAVVPRLAAAAQKGALAALYPAQSSSSTIAYPSCCRVKLEASSATATGTIAWVLGGEETGILVGFGAGAHGTCAFAAPIDHPTVKRTPTTSLDLTLSLTTIELTQTPVVIFDAQTSIKIEDTLEAVKACEAAGICQRVVEMTTEYVKTRQQFGVAIGAFQAIQHKLADCYARSEALASLSSFAAWSADHSQDQQHLTARAAILEAARTAPFVCETAIQAHGGIGFTWEYDLHLYLRRAKLIQSAFSFTEARSQELIDAVAR